MRANLLVTDYSSICADFYYLRKPVLFYQFDMQEYSHKVGSYIDLKNDIFGDVSYQEEALVKKMIKTIKNGFKISPLQKNGEKYFIYYTDNNNCKRIYNKIDKLLVKG
jgi:CDP-glycerol glycerophosphotransferase (TagB/SpsB family)